MTVTTDSIRVLIVDDHAIVRIGLTRLLESMAGIEVVAAVAGGEEALQLSTASPPDVVLMDVSMPGLDGIETTRRMVAARPDTRVVMLTSFADDERVADAIDAGAIGYLLKDADPDDLVRGIRAAARGEAPLDPRAARALLSTRGERRPGDQLSAREREVLGLLVKGLSNKQIAWRLNIRERTVKAHLTSVFQRIGVADRTQAALWAQQHGVADAGQG